MWVRTLVTWTLKGDKKQFELAGLGYRDRLDIQFAVLKIIVTDFSELQ